MARVAVHGDKLKLEAIPAGGSPARTESRIRSESLARAPRPGGEATAVFRNHKEHDENI